MERVEEEDHLHRRSVQKVLVNRCKPMGRGDATASAHYWRHCAKHPVPTGLSNPGGALVEAITSARSLMLIS